MGAFADHLPKIVVTWPVRGKREWDENENEAESWQVERTALRGAAANAKDCPDVRVISYVSRQDAKTVLTMAQAVKARKLVIPIERKVALVHPRWATPATENAAL